MGNNGFVSYNLDDVDTARIHDALICAFQSYDNSYKTQRATPYTCVSNIDNAPPISVILKRIPYKENIKSVFLTPGIYSLIHYLYDDHEISGLLPLLFSNTAIDSSDRLYKRLSTVNEKLIYESLDHYFCKFVCDSKVVFNAIIKCAPLVIAAHRSRLTSIQSLLSKQDSNSPTYYYEEALFKLPYKDIRLLRSQSQIPGDLDENTDSDVSQYKMRALDEIDIFRSPNYSLIPYFDVELHLLKEINPLGYTKALNYLDELVSEREHILPMESESFHTYRPRRCIKLMSFVSRKIFDGMPPCDNKRVYNSVNIEKKGLASDYAPILSLNTNDGQPLTRAHGEIYDAICTLWEAGNKVVTDGMIARTIWPRTSYHGSETFSPTELKIIRQLMDELRNAYISIDATEELRKYKKIGQDDYWKISDYAIPSSIIYTSINGGVYHRSYRLLRTPVLFAYSSVLAQVFSGPITILEQNDKATKRVARTLKSAQVRTFLLERIHHFGSNSYKKKENYILFDRVYDAYQVRDCSSQDVEKKDRAAARKAALDALANFRRDGLITDYKLIKKGGKYISISIYL